MRKIQLYGAAAQAAMLGNLSLGRITGCRDRALCKSHLAQDQGVIVTPGIQPRLVHIVAGSRSFSTVQAAKPQTTAQVLQQWEQETHAKQQPNSNSQQAAKQMPYTRKAVNRRRGNQRLNIVSSGQTKGTDRSQQGSLALSSQLKHGGASLSMPSTSADPHNHQAANPNQSHAAKQAGPKGTNLRSLATSALLLSHAQLLQQLQQNSQTDMAPTVSSKASQATRANRRPRNSQQRTASAKYAQVAQHPAAARLDPAQQHQLAEQDTMSLALDLVDNQLPHWSHKQPLDWSAQQDLSCYQPEVGLLLFNGDAWICLACAYKAIALLHSHTPMC